MMTSGIFVLRLTNDPVRRSTHKERNRPKFIKRGMRSKNVDGRDKPGHDGELIGATRPRDPRQNSTAERDAIPS
jgi:hypothetical protein